MGAIMENFEMYTPTRAVFGKGVLSGLGNLVRAQGCSTVLVHYGSERIRTSGLLTAVERALQDAGVNHVLLGGVVPNPRLSKVREGIDLCRKAGVDFILAVGGGSVIDSAKAIGLGCVTDEDVWHFFEGIAKPSGCLPLGCVLTLAATGSEMGNVTVITNEDGWLKRTCHDDACRCRFAIMDPEMQYSLPVYQTMSGCADILMHTMERYFSLSDTMELTDAIAESLLRTVMHNALVLKGDPKNYRARAEVLWAGSLSHNGLTGCGAVGDWATHKIEHELSGMFDVAHGAGLTAVWGSWARMVYRERVGRFVRFAVEVMGVRSDYDHPDRTALAGIEAMEAFFRSIGMPTDLPGLGIAPTSAQLDEMARKCSRDDTFIAGTFRPLDRQGVREVLRRAMGTETV